MNLIDLEVHSLGDFMVKKNDDIISDSSRGADKLWTLFQYLLSHPSESVTPDRIIDDLDFSMELVDAKNALENRIYRLRKLLAGGDKYKSGKYIEFSRGGYKLNWENGGWFDIKEFQHSCQQGEKLYLAGDKQEAVDEFLSAFKVYKGDYLRAQHTSSWVINKRVQYRHMFLEVVLNAAEILEDLEEYFEREKILKRAAKIEPFEEVVQKKLLETYLQQNKVNKAKRYYSYLKTLFAQIGVEPFPELDWNKYSVDLKPKNSKSQKFDENYLEEKLKDTKKELEFVSSECFQELVILEKKRTFRYRDMCSYIASVNLEITDLSVDEEKKVLEKIDDKLKSNLRSSDIVCHCDKDKILILFVNSREEDVNAVIARINNEISSVENQGNFQFNFSYQAI